ncbi:MAG: protease-like activity factor CPAF [Bacteriovoracaceae bacterium]|nr:protease-like activity factor CPAF [Bacteriovoracaceae bacterium]
MNNKTYFIFILSFLSFWASANDGLNNVQKLMLGQLDFIHNIYEARYAPADWKKEHFGWDLNQIMSQSKDAITTNSEIKVKDYYNIVSKFFYSTRDYHVGFAFDLTEKAKLPLIIRSAENKYFIAYINRKKLSTESFPFNPGDEVITFGGRPVSEVTKELQRYFTQNVASTDKAFAELTLTSRSAKSAMPVPRGPITLEIKQKNSTTIKSFQLMWDYTPEKLDYSRIENKSMFNNFHELTDGKKLLQLIDSKKYESILAKNLKRADAENLFNIGGKKSYVPDLGAKIWESDKDNKFHAYIYRHDSGKIIGYIRIPHYSGSEERFKAFKKIIKKYDAVTDGLIIDQINNPGGSLFYIYALISVLTDKTIVTPKEQETIVPSNVKSAYTYLPLLSDIRNDEEVHKFFGEKNWNGYPLNMLTIYFLKGYFRHIIKQWELGNRLATPFYMWGTDHVNPDKEVNYTKPIVVLTNELDFSGGDFFPAILQDNKRATILGTRTAGAGGYVQQIRYPNMLGLSYFSYTGSIAKRVNNEPIENLGVTPDVEYSHTAKDYQENFVDYKEKINKTIKSLLQ